MKKIVLLLAIVATFTVTSCNNKNTQDKTETVDTTTVVTPQVDTVETTTTVEVDTITQ